MTEDKNYESVTESEEQRGQNCAVTDQDTGSKLREMNSILARADKISQSRRAELARKTEERERETERRVLAVQARMSENTERAREAAEDRAALLAYGGEYRQRIAARENKRAKAEAERERAFQLEAEREKKEAREREIEEFKQRELLAEEARRKRTAELMGALFESHGKPDQSCDDEKDESAKCIEAENGDLTEEQPVEISETAEKSPCDDAPEEPCDDSTADDGFILKIGGTNTEKCDTGASDDGKTVLNIAAYTVGGAYPPPRMHAPYGYQAPNALHPNADRTKSANNGYSRDLESARLRHESLRAAAIAAAQGIYAEEERRLYEEEKRYAAELADIRARSSAYSDRSCFSDPDAYSASYLSDPYAHRDGTSDAVRELGESEEYRQLVNGERSERDSRLISDYDRYREGLDSAREAPRTRQRTEPCEPIRDYTDEIQNSLPDAHIEPHGTQGEIFIGARKERGASDEKLRAADDHSKIRHANDTFAEIAEARGTYHSAAVVSFDRAQLGRYLERFAKDEYALEKKLEKLDSRRKNATPEENISIIVGKIAVAKELCEISSEALGACVSVDSRTKLSKYKRILERRIDGYNILADEYESATGRAVERIDDGMVTDVIEGRLSKPIPTVHYYGADDDDRSGEWLNPDTDKARRQAEEERLIKEEYDRYSSGVPYSEPTKAERRAAAKQQAERMSRIKRAAERDMLLIGLRHEHQIASLETERDLLVNSYGKNKRENSKEIKAIDRRIAKLRRESSRAAKAEREENSRYYLLPAIPLADEKKKKRARLDRLEALRLRLDVLLAERESLNERLIALYGGSDKKLKVAKIKRKARTVRRKSANAMYKKQAAVAKKIDRFKAPEDMKERAYELLNKKTECAATIEENKYKIKKLKPEGRARTEMLGEIKRAKKTMRRTERELKYMMRRLARQEERYKSDRRWIVVVAVLLILAAVCVGIWYFFGDSIKGYFYYLKEWLLNLK